MSSPTLTAPFTVVRRMGNRTLKEVCCGAGLYAEVLKQALSAIQMVKRAHEAQWNRGEPLKPAARAPGPFPAIAKPPADPARAFVPCAAPGSRATLWQAALHGQPARYFSSWRSAEARSSCDATRAPRSCQGVHLLLNAELPRSCDDHDNLAARQPSSVDRPARWTRQPDRNNSEIRVQRGSWTPRKLARERINTTKIAITPPETAGPLVDNSN